MMSIIIIIIIIIIISSSSNDSPAQAPHQFLSRQYQHCLFTSQRVALRLASRRGTSQPGISHHVPSPGDAPHRTHDVASALHRAVLYFMASHDTARQDRMYALYSASCFGLFVLMARAARDQIRMAQRET